MANLEFSHTYPYRYDPNGNLLPLVPLRLHLAKDYVVEFLALLDTGAERTLLEGVHLRAAGMDVFEGKPLTFQGFLGARTVAYLHPARVAVANQELEIEVAFSTQPLLRPVLGRDLLAHFKLGLRERTSELYLEPETTT